MDDKKLETVKRLEDLLKVTIEGFQYLFPINNPYTNNLQKVKIMILGAEIRTVDVEGDSPDQIVKDVLNTIWRMR